MLKDALAGLPTRPILYLSLTVLVLGLAYHFTTTYQRCRNHADLREALRVAIEASAKGAAPVQLSAITDFAWDRADILVNYKPSGSIADCPFQWDWSRETRAKLIAGDLLTVILFVQGGKLVNYLEYRRDRADFVDVKNPYTPETAVFRATSSPNDPDRFTLSPIP